MKVEVFSICSPLEISQHSTCFLVSQLLRMSDDPDAVSLGSPLEPVDLTDELVSIGPIMLDDCKIGSGGLGSIYAIDDDIVLKYVRVYIRPRPEARTETHEIYAIRTLENYSATTNERALYRRLQQRPHPNLVEAIDIYPEGVYMRRYQLLRDRTTTREERLLIYQDVLRGLIHLHNMRIAHNDVLSFNVLIDSQGHAVLCDFGESCPFGRPNDIPRDPSMVISRGGLAKSISDATDRFAMGRFIYEMEMKIEFMTFFYPDEIGHWEPPAIDLGHSGIEAVVLKAWRGEYSSTVEMLEHIQSLSGSDGAERDRACSDTLAASLEELKDRVKQWRNDRVEKYGELCIASTLYNRSHASSGVVANELPTMQDLQRRADQLDIDLDYFSTDLRDYLEGQDNMTTSTDILGVV